MRLGNRGYRISEDELDRITSRSEYDPKTGTYSHAIISDTGKSEPCQAKRKNKFNATKIVTEEGTFDSKAEYQRWQELKYMPGISNLENHVKYVLLDGERQRDVIEFTPDFRYVRDSDGVTVVEDAKSKATITEAFMLRWKLLRRLHPEIEMVLAISIKRGRRTEFEFKVWKPEGKL